MAHSATNHSIINHALILANDSLNLSCR